MIIEILIGIVGLFAVIILDHLLIPLGFLSIWAFLSIYLYQKVEKTIFWIILIVMGISLGVTISLGLATYLLSAGFAILFLFLVKKITPEEYLVIRYIQYFFSLFIFYLLRLVFGELSVNSVLPNIGWGNILNYAILALVSTIACILIDRFYFQIRSNSKISGRGIGIEIRRK